MFEDAYELNALFIEKFKLYVTATRQLDCGSGSEYDTEGFQ